MKIEEKQPGAAGFKTAMRRFGATVWIVTAADEGRSYGIVATSVCSVSDSPPSLLVCVNRRASVYEPILRSKTFALNLLAASQEEIAQRFTSPDDAVRNRRFEGVVLRAGAAGAPMIEGCAASFDCHLVEEVIHDTHSIFIGNVAEVAADTAIEPLMYLDGRYVRPKPYTPG